MIKYFVSFTHKSGSGMVEVDYPEEIKGLNDVIDIKRSIEKDDNCKDVVIMNIQRFPI